MTYDYNSKVGKGCISNGQPGSGITTLAKWLLEFLGIPRNKGVNFHGKFGLGIPRNS